jgi:hypothetical protein
MSDDDFDTEPYEGPTSSPEEMRYLEQDEAYDNYAQTSAQVRLHPVRYPRTPIESSVLDNKLDPCLLPFLRLLQPFMGLLMLSN